MIKAINCSSGRKPCYTENTLSAPAFTAKKNDETQQLTGFNRPKNFFAKIQRFKAGVGAYASGIPSALGTAALGGAGVFSLVDLGGKLMHYEKGTGVAKKGGLLGQIAKPYKDGIGKFGNFLVGLFKDSKGESVSFGKGLAKLVAGPFVAAGKFAGSIFKKGCESRVPKIFAAAAFIGIAAHGIVKTKMALNEKNAEIDHRFKIKHGTTIPEAPPLQSTQR